MNALISSGIFISATSLILILMLLCNEKTSLHKIWTVFNMSVFTWGAGCFLAGKATAPEAALLGWKIAISGGLFLAAFFYQTVYIFSNIKKKKVLTYVHLQALTFFLLTNFTPLILTDFTVKFGSLFYNTANLLYTFMVMNWGYVVYLALKELFKVLRHSTGFRRMQARYLFIAFSIGFIGGGSTLLPALGINLYPLANLGVAIYAVIGTYAILKYRILDINIAITRTGIFIAVYTVILGLPFALTINSKNWLIGLLGVNWWSVPLGFMAVLATAGPFLYIYLQRKAEERLLREQKRYQDTLKHVSIGMTRIRNLQRLLNLIAHIVTKTVRIASAAIYLFDEQSESYVLHVKRQRDGKDRHTVIESPAAAAQEGSARIPFKSTLTQYLLSQPEALVYEEIKRFIQDNKANDLYVQLEKEMKEIDASVIVPSFLDTNLVGFMVLGDKISGQIYTPEDLNVFQVLANQAALAIENAQFYEDTKRMQEQVAQAEKMATIGTMADGLSHQINNRFYALSLIAGDTIDTIRMTDTAPCSPEIKTMISEITHALERIQANVTQGGEVVRGILKYTRKGEEGLEPLTLDQVIDGTLLMVQYKVKLAEMDLVRDYPKTLPKIKGNLVQLQEVFFNFIDNAYEAIVERRLMLKEEGYKGHIVFKARLIDIATMRIEVEDNGMGVKEENMRKLFTPFFTTKVSSRKGTGLGLYVINKIITETHNGKIKFDSTYKVGTRFIVELPVAEESPK